jgi:Fur family transcriptional regulator, ferric uptake regulator
LTDATQLHIVNATVLHLQNNSMIKHDCKDELRMYDLKVTPARLGVLEALENAHLPLSAEDITHYLTRKTIKADRVTVFRIMNTFMDKGIIRPIQFNDGKLRYEYSGKPDHHHFICEDCGVVEDIPECNIAILEKSLQQKKGLLIKRHSLEFFGLCKRCSN